MGRKTNLTEADLQDLLKTKIKEPGITFDQLYTDISRIHAKPYWKFYISLGLWVVSVILILSLNPSFTWCSILFIVFVLSSVYAIFLQKNHCVIAEVPWYVLTGVAILTLGVCHPKLKLVGIEDYLIDLASKLFNGRTS